MSTSVRWSAVFGTFSLLGSEALYNAPWLPATDTLIVRSTADSTKFALATVTVDPASAPKLHWAILLTQPEGAAQGIAVFRDTIVVAGVHWIENGDLTLEPWLRGYSSSGTQLWALDPPRLGEGFINSKATYGASVYFGGRSGTRNPGGAPMLLAVTSSGTLRFQTCAGLVGDVLAIAGDGDRFYLATWTQANPAVILTADAGGTIDCGNAFLATERSGPRVKGLALSGTHLVATGLYSTPRTPDSCWSNNGYVRKMDLAGNKVWDVSFLDLVGPRSVLGEQVVVATEGGQEFVYVVGTLLACDETRQEIYAAKFDGSGNLIWERTWDGENARAELANWGTNIIVDPEGGVIVAGQLTELITSDVNEGDWGLISYGPDGAVRWKFRWDYGEGETPRDIVLAGDGTQLYVVGMSITHPTGSPVDLPRPLLAKFLLPR